MKHGKGLVACIFVFTLAANAEIEMLQHDSFSPGDVVSYQSDFQPGEIAAVRFVPQIQCPCLVTDIALLFAGSPEVRNIGFKIWQDADGNVEPGTLMLHDFTTLTPSDIDIQTVDVRSSSVVVHGPFRVGIQFLSLGLPAVVTDTDGTIAENANYLLSNTGTFNWSSAVSENLSGDFVVRASIDNVVLSDVDADGVANDSDNCVQRSNADQRDTDNDAIGNFCDSDVAEPNDCVVNFLDFAVYRENFEMTGDLDTDNNGDGVTNFIDFSMFVNYFLSAPGPSASGCN